jgi:hypothetical protein
MRRTSLVLTLLALLSPTALAAATPAIAAAADASNVEPTETAAGGGVPAGDGAATDSHPGGELAPAPDTGKAGDAAPGEDTGDTPPPGHDAGTDGSGAPGPDPAQPSRAETGDLGRSTAPRPPAPPPLAAGPAAIRIAPPDRPAPRVLDRAPAVAPATSEAGQTIPSLAALTATRDRPLFVPGRRGAMPVQIAAPAPVVETTEPSPPPLTLVLNGVVSGPGVAVAILREPGGSVTRMKAGEERDGWTLAEINRLSVIFRRGAEEEVLTLKPPGSSATAGGMTATPPESPQSEGFGAQ